MGYRVGLVALVAGLVSCGSAQPASQQAATTPMGQTPAVDAVSADSEVLSGTVISPAGKPVVGARVCLEDRDIGETIRSVETDASGRYEFALPPGRYALAASGAGFTSAMTKTFAVGDGVDTSRTSSRPDSLQLARGGGTFQGRLTISNPNSEPRPVVILDPQDGWRASVCVVPDVNGRFSVQVPAGRYYLFLGDKEYDWYIVHTAYDVEEGEATTISQPLHRRADLRELASKQVLADLRTVTVPLKAAEAGNGFDDLAKLDHLVKGARVVALGEATHGTREFFQLKHRMLEYLVERHGFSVFAIEGIFSESIAVNDYVLHGKGDVHAALASMYFWVWDTEEVIALIEWMKSYNSDPAHTTKLRFYGVDMQFTPGASAAVRSFLARINSPLVESTGNLWVKLAESGWNAEYRYKSSREEVSNVRQKLDALIRAFESDRQKMIAATSASEYRLARQHLRILEQAELTFRPSKGSFDARDRSMADNTMWILEEDPSVKVVLWAHNRHIQEVSLGFRSQGTHLRERLGDAYVTFGFSFNQGSFQARDSLKGRKSGVTEVTVGPTIKGNIEHTYSQLGYPIAAIDLRAAAKVPSLVEYFSIPRMMRETGSGWSEAESRNFGYNHLTDFDAMFFFERTTRARPTPNGIRRPGE